MRGLADDVPPGVVAAAKRVAPLIASKKVRLLLELTALEEG